ncbi:MAG: FtsQ-type POTRA domain-containing protein [Actinobacteria bacterium]|nr:FtsQ-type POTRA domain-containing protein [Actinomycetota bacterium]
MNAKGKKTAIATLLLATVIAIAYLLGWSSVFVVKSLAVRGAPSTSVAKIIETRSGIHVGDKLARIETRKIQSTLSDISWLDHVNIARNWLRGSIVISVSEKSPVAKFRGHLLDEQGSEFDLPQSAKVPVPTITATTQQLAKLGLLLMYSLPEDIRSKVSGISVASRQVLSFTIAASSTREIAVEWGNLEDSEVKIKVYRTLIALPENRKIIFMDLSSPFSPIVK